MYRVYPSLQLPQTGLLTAVASLRLMDALVPREFAVIQPPLPYAPPLLRFTSLDFTGVARVGLTTCSKRGARLGVYRLSRLTPAFTPPSPAPYPSIFVTYTLTTLPLLLSPHPSACFTAILSLSVTAFDARERFER